MYITPSGPAKGFYPGGQKWGGSSSTPRVAALRPGQTHYARLGDFRPNQPMARGMIPGGGTRRTAVMGCMGDCGACGSNCPGRLGSSIVGDRRRRALGDDTTAPNYIPAGTEFFYQAQRQAGFVWGAGDIASIVSYIQSNSDLVIDKSSSTTGDQPTITIYGHSQVDHGLLNDIKGILDGAMQASGRQLTGSQISILSSGAPAIAPTPSSTSSFDLSSFLSDNWMYLAAGGAALIVAKEYL